MDVSKAVISGVAFTASAAALLAAMGMGMEASAAITLGVTLLCAMLWMSEALPLPATALIPLAVFPLTGVLDAKAVAQAYGNPIILLFLGGFLLSRGMEDSGAHRRIALGLIHLFGASGKRLLWGVMAASALLSMWVSNTATVLMLLPVVLAMVDGGSSARMMRPLLLGVAYAASIGGLGTPIGSPPNLVFLQVAETTLGQSIGFLQWMSWGLPVVALMLPLAGLWLGRNLLKEDVVDLPDAGPWTVAQRRVLCVFALTALAWVTRSDPFGGWSVALGLPGASDASVALLGALLLFLISNGEGGKLLTWESAERIPWGMLILFGGGITIATAFVQSGLSELLGAQVAAIAALPTIALVALVCTAVIFLTEINSNTATAVLLMPILAATALATETNPLLLMLPAAMAASCAFMLPVATPPNAIVFGSGRITIREMVREGLVLNLIGVVIVTTSVVLLIA